MKSPALEHLDELFRLLKLLNIPESPELAAARAAIDELMKASESYTAAMADIARRMQALPVVQCPMFVLPAPDPAVAKTVEAVQQRIAESLKPKWDEKYDWENTSIN